jgi:hypothetical protein
VTAFMLAYHFLHLLKFAGVILFGGGLIGSFVATVPANRKRAVHAIASPGLVVSGVPAIS